MSLLLRAATSLLSSGWCGEIELLLDSSGEVRGLRGSGRVLRVSSDCDCWADSPRGIALVAMLIQGLRQQLVGNLRIGPLSLQLAHSSRQSHAEGVSEQVSRLTFGQTSRTILGYGEFLPESIAISEPFHVIVVTSMDDQVGRVSG